MLFCAHADLLTYLYYTFLYLHTAAITWLLTVLAISSLGRELTWGEIFSSRVLFPALLQCYYYSTPLDLHHAGANPRYPLSGSPMIISAIYQQLSRVIESKPCVCHGRMALHPYPHPSISIRGSTTSGLCNSSRSTRKSVTPVSPPSPFTSIPVCSTPPQLRLLHNSIFFRHPSIIAIAKRFCGAPPAWPLMCNAPFVTASWCLVDPLISTRRIHRVRFGFKCQPTN